MSHKNPRQHPHRIRKHRSMPAVSSIDKSGAGSHKLDQEKRTKNKELKEIQDAINE